MSQVLLERLGGLWVGEGVSHGAVTIFPLTGGRQGKLNYSLLDEAVGNGGLEVRELESASVGQLLAVNKGSLPVLLLDGEELVGGKQNRTVNSSVLVPSGQTVLPVSCVEQGRWHNLTPTFSSSEASYPSLRAARTRQVRDSLRARGVHESDQGGVWASVQARQVAASVASHTGAMAHIYSERRDTLQAYERALPYRDGAIGLIAAVGGKITSMDVFDSPLVMEKLWAKLIRACAVDALSLPPGNPVEKERAVRMLNRARYAKFEWFRTPGLGEDVRVSGNGVVGAALLHDGVVVHSALFRQH
ncbi:MAG: hypothetical protein M3Q29_24010 [Chloroflexota bacterium]|nr:hypothetical protein [Chloroflexota bacterium]